MDNDNITLHISKNDYASKTGKNGHVYIAYCDFVYDECWDLRAKSKEEAEKNASLAFNHIKRLLSRYYTILKASYDVNMNPFEGGWVCPMSIYLIEKNKKPKWIKTNLVLHITKGNKQNG